ncbi:lysophospholipid acyltransferase family protein [Roseobacter sp. HKCCA0434]|uniref:lysophospholipid acyltransferase family protein n=1 Tax=Roseobacter sp. HKCCA0434 TaxID=3079297 RepID=UPI002905A48E|nr:lysophospholipid acyltransferase family protein [Roseobacter sp. HKCCA0434]
MTLSERLTDWGHYLSNGVLRVMGRLLRLLPYDRRVHFGGWLGRNVLMRIPAARKRVERNLTRIMPELDAEQRRTLGRGVGDNFGRVLVEEMMMEDVIADPARFRISGPGWPLLQERAAEGKGAILATAHFGNWEGLRTSARDAGVPIGGVYRAHNNPYYNEDFVATLRVLNENAFSKGRSGMRDLLRFLKRGGIVAILVDQKQSRAPLIPFLGHPAETTLSAAKLARSLDIPLIPVCSSRAEDGLSFDSIVAAPIPVGTEEEMMRAVNDQLSAWIRAHPEQWFWFHRRWR